MRRIAASLVLLCWVLSASAAAKASGRVCKVLAQYLDEKGRQSLSPSLYERDAYQAVLRRTPGMRKTLRLVVEYRARELDWPNARLRVEMRGLVTNTLQTVTLEQPVKKSGWFGNWADFDISGDDYKKFGELEAWRVTLWEGDKPLSEKRSFLWTGVPNGLH